MMKKQLYNFSLSPQEYVISPQRRLDYFILQNSKELCIYHFFKDLFI